MICVIAAGKATAIAATAFALSWTHSVEKTRWTERWTAGPEGLTVVEGRVEGSGAGMEPPADAVLKDGVYVYRPHVPPIEQLTLAASGATVGGWTLCPDGDGCRVLGAESSEPIAIRWCAAASGQTSQRSDAVRR